MTSPYEKTANTSTGFTKKFPTSKEVEDFHRYSDVDRSVLSQHHTLGYGSKNGAPGDHDHRDGAGTPLLPDVVLTGNVTANTASVLKQVCDALEKLGATDNTTGP